jgi:hypothetical protein
LFYSLLKPFTDIAKQYFTAAIDEEQNEEKQELNSSSTNSESKYRGPAAQKLWKLLMNADHMSVRQFLGS